LSSLKTEFLRDYACPVLACKYRGMMKAKVIVMPKAAVLDPQGNAVRDAMRHLGMPEVRSVRIGKYMEIDIDGQDGDFESRLHRLCRDLLSNPVIEDYELQNTDRGNYKKTSNSDKSRAGAQRPKSKTKRTRLRSPRRPTARQARKSSR
jgi:phosphoribosylformylglycinamidine synthase